MTSRADERCPRCDGTGGLTETGKMGELFCENCGPVDTAQRVTPDAAMIERVRGRWKFIKDEYVRLNSGWPGTKTFADKFEADLRALCDAWEQRENLLLDILEVNGHSDTCPDECFGCDIMQLNGKGGGENAAPDAVTSRPDSSTAAPTDPTPTDDGLVGECAKLADVLFHGHGVSAKDGAVLLRRAAAEIERLERSTMYHD